MIIYTFDAVKALFEALGYCAECHPFFVQSLAHYNILAIFPNYNVEGNLQTEKSGIELRLNLLMHTKMLDIFLL